MMKIYFLTTIDTECDKRTDWSVRYPFEFRNILEGVQYKLLPVLRKYGAVPTFLLSPEIIMDDRCCSFFLTMRNESELGTHLHSEYIEPFSDFESFKTDAYQTDLSYAIELAKIKNLTELFQRRFGYRPLSFRSGRFGISSNTLKILNDFGYKVDSSIFPFKKIKTKLHKLDFYYYPVKPYYPDLANYGIESQSGQKTILHVPITVSSPFFQVLPQWIGRPLSKFSAAHRLIQLLVGRKVFKTISLRPSTITFDLLKEVCDRHIGRHEPHETVFLNMMFHSNELTEGTSPYCKTPEDVALFLNKLNQIYAYTLSIGAEFIKMSESRTIIEANKNANG